MRGATFEVSNHSTLSSSKKSHDISLHTYVLDSDLETTHFFTQAVKPTIILPILLHTFARYNKILNITLNKLNWPNFIYLTWFSKILTVTSPSKACNIDNWLVVVIIKLVVTSHQLAS